MTLPLAKSDKHIRWKELALAALVSLGLAGGTAFAQATTTTQADTATDAPATPPGPATPPPPPPPPAAPPPPPPPPDLAMYLAVNGQTTGPFGKAEIEAKIKSGEITAQSMVWQDGMAAWASASTVAELQAMMTAVKPVFDPKAYIVGSWETAAVPVPIPGLPEGGSLSGTTTYNADGSLVLFGTLSWNQPNPMQPGSSMPVRASITGTGTYAVQGLSPTSFIVNPQVTLTMSIPGMPPSTDFVTDPINLTVIDQNTTRDSDGAVSRRTN